jgi:hypothetical protein
MFERTNNNFGHRKSLGMPKSDKMIERVDQFLGNEGNESKKINSYCMRYQSIPSNKQQSIDEYEEWECINVKDGSVYDVTSRNSIIMIEIYRAKNYAHDS